jgi:hypothetical protein
MVKNEQKCPFLTLVLVSAIDTLPIGDRGAEGAFLAIYSRGYWSSSSLWGLASLYSATLAISSGQFR